MTRTAVLIGALTTLSALLIAGCSGQRNMFLGTTMRFGEGAPVAIDGRRAPGEWDDALTLPMSESGDVTMKRHGDCLYLTVHTERVRPLCVAFTRGDELLVALVDRTLSTARYAPDGDAWRLDTAFHTVKARAEDRRAIENHFLRTGWTASTGAYSGDSDVEFRLRLPEEGLRLALVMSLTRRYQPPHWPAGLEGDLLEPLIFSGVAPKRMDFRADHWPLFLPEDPTRQ